MINFFRKTRKKLADDNKPLKYARYAIGEIMLVVIGILIALSINNWNEELKERGKEQQLLIQLMEEYTSNLAQLDQKILMRNENISNSFKMIEYIDNPDGVLADSILFYASLCCFTQPTFDPIENDLINSGKLELIQDRNLKHQLTSWHSDVQQLREVEQSWWDFVEGTVNKYFIDNNFKRNQINSFWQNKGYNVALIDREQTIEGGLGNSKYKIDYPSLLKDPKLESLVSTSIWFASFGNSESKTLRNKILLILKLIDDNLSNDTIL